MRNPWAVVEKREVFSEREGIYHLPFNGDITGVTAGCGLIHLQIPTSMKTPHG